MNNSFKNIGHKNVSEFEKRLKEIFDKNNNSEYFKKLGNLIKLDAGTLELATKVSMVAFKFLIVAVVEENKVITKELEWKLEVAQQNLQT